MKNTRKKNAGFTLAALILIFAILSALSVGALSTARTELSRARAFREHEQAALAAYSACAQYTTTAEPEFEDGSAGACVEDAEVLTITARCGLTTLVYTAAPPAYPFTRLPIKK